jgi:polysaccharide biosynthesis protein PslH
MRILYLASEFPFPPLAHATLRTQAFLRAWVAKGVDVEFVCFPHGSVDLTKAPSGLNIRQIAPLRGFKDKISDWLMTHHYKRTSHSSMAQLSQLVESAEPFDAAVGEELAMGRALLWLKTNHPKKVKKVIYVAHNNEASLYKQVKAPKTWLEKHRFAWLEKFEQKVMDEMDATFAFSETLREELQKRKPKGRLLATMACYDFSRLNFQQDRSQRRHLLLIGALDYHPNVEGLQWFAQEIYPKIKAKPPVLVAGSHPTEAVVKLCKKNGFELVDTPENMSQVLDRGRVEIVPLRLGSGVRGKIIEALGCGLPVVSTTLGAEGLPVKPDVHMLLGDTADSLASQVDRLYRDPSLYAGLSREGKTLAQRFDCKSVAEKMLERIQAL